MFKKTFILLSCVVFAFSIYLLNALPVIKNAKGYEVYLQNYSSNAVIKTVDFTDYMFLSDIKGESVKFSAEEFNQTELLNNLNAVIVFTETLDGVYCIYAYSPKIRYRQTVNGKTVNVQIAVRGEQITVGCPIIYGSF